MHAFTDLKQQQSVLQKLQAANEGLAVAEALCLLNAASRLLRLLMRPPNNTQHCATTSWLLLLKGRCLGACCGITIRAAPTCTTVYGLARDAAAHRLHMYLLWLLAAYNASPNCLRTAIIGLQGCRFDLGRLLAEQATYCQMISVTIFPTSRANNKSTEHGARTSHKLAAGEINRQNHKPRHDRFGFTQPTE